MSKSDIMDMLKIEQINDYIIDNESGVNHCKRKKLEMGEGKAHMNLCWIRIRSIGSCF